MSGIPMPPSVIPRVPDVVEDKKVPEKTVKFILDKHLHRDNHRYNPVVLSFIDNYMHYLDVRKASDETGITYKQGKDLRNRPDIAKAIGELTDIAVEKYGYSAAEVVERVKEVLNFDPAILENKDGTYKEKLSDIPFEMRGAIKKFKVKNEYGIDANGMRTVVGKIIEVEMWDKMKAADMLGKEKDVFKDSLDINQNVKISISSALQEANMRVINARDVTDEQ